MVLLVSVQNYPDAFPVPRWFPLTVCLQNSDSAYTADITAVYHIHAAPLDAAGNCTKALAHLDPYQRGEQPPCDSAQPQNCQVGDLSGKHGNITTSPFHATYIDLYTSTEQGIGSYFGNRSLVVHSNNATRLNCANFTLVSGGNGGAPTPSPIPSASLPPGASGNPTSTGPPIPTFTGAATRLHIASAWAAILVGILVIHA